MVHSQLEREALQYVPGLERKLAELKREHRKRQAKIMAALLVAIALVLGGVVYVVSQVSQGRPAPVVIDPAKLPPIVPGPQR